MTSHDSVESRRVPCQSPEVSPSIRRACIGSAFRDTWTELVRSDERRGIRVQDLPDTAPVTLLTGRFIDQAALAGVLGTLYDLGYPLLNVELLDAQPLRKA